jgi:hypothetical protein
MSNSTSPANNTPDIEEAWRWPPPKTEAAACLRVALSNGGLAKMRQTISITDGEKAELLSWAAEEPTLTSKILGAIRYRDDVIREFDLLVGTPARDQN